MRIDKAIYVARLKRGWTQKELSRRSGVTASAISMIEAGQRQPTFAVVEKISTAFVIPLLGHFNETAGDKTNREMAEFYSKFSGIVILTQDNKNLIIQIANRLQPKK